VKRVGWKNIFNISCFVFGCFEYNNSKVIFRLAEAYLQFLRKYLRLLVTDLKNELVSPRIKCIYTDGRVFSKINAITLMQKFRTLST